MGGRHRIDLQWSRDDSPSSTMNRPLALLVALQLTDSPPFNSWGQLVVFLIAVGMVVNWIWRFVKEKRTNGVPKVASRVEGILERLERVTDTQSVSITGLTTSVDALNCTIRLLGERLTNISTKLDLKRAAEENGHKLRKVIAHD